MHTTPVDVFVGRFKEERFLCHIPNYDHVPHKGDFVFYEDAAYKVMYNLHDIESNVLCVFVREAVEEDY